MLPDIVVESALAAGGSHILTCSDSYFYVLYEELPTYYRKINQITGQFIHRQAYKGNQNYFNYGYNTEGCEIIPLKINLENV